MGIALIVYLLVVASLSVPLIRAARSRDRLSASQIPPELAPPESQERRLRRVVSGAVGATVLILLVLLLADFVTHQNVSSMPEGAEPLDIELTGHRWWWEVKYLDPVPSNIVTTANEIHIPVGRPIRFRLRSQDVIHSFWMPNLHGKKDLVPGRPTTTWFVADEPGEFEGPCAEFCGHQHAKMRLKLIAQPEEEFESWLSGQSRPAPPPSTEQQRRGQEVFLTSACTLCHTILGTPAAGKIGPDLTHLASRSRIAAGTLPNRRGHLAGWILDPHGIKPGVNMPPNPMPAEDLIALLDYLESLK